MLLLAWRVLRVAWSRNTTRVTVVVSGLFLVLNVIGGTGARWYPTELLVLLGLFVLGTRSLIRELKGDNLVEEVATPSAECGATD